MKTTVGNFLFPFFAFWFVLGVNYGAYVGWVNPELIDTANGNTKGMHLVICLLWAFVVDVCLFAWMVYLIVNMKFWSIEIDLDKLKQKP